MIGLFNTYEYWFIVTGWRGVPFMISIAANRLSAASYMRASAKYMPSTGSYGWPVYSETRETERIPSITVALPDGAPHGS
jgi:hypothetical protein